MFSLRSPAGCQIVAGGGVTPCDLDESYEYESDSDHDTLSKDNINKVTLFFGQQATSILINCRNTSHKHLMNSPD